MTITRASAIIWAPGSPRTADRIGIGRPTVDTRSVPRRRNAAGSNEQLDAILDAAEQEFADNGLGSASLDTVATSAGVSRSTLYRRFPNKAALVAAVLDRTLSQVTSQLHYAITGLGPQDAVVEAFTLGFRWLRNSKLLSQLMSEDSRIWVDVTGPIGAWIIDRMTHDIENHLRAAGSVMPADQLRATADILIRLAISYAEHPSPVFDIADDESVRTFARTTLAPMVR